MRPYLASISFRSLFFRLRNGKSFSPTEAPSYSAAYESVCKNSYSIFDIDIQEPIAYAHSTVTVTVSEALNTQAEIALMVILI